MATERPMGKRIELRAYAGTDPATGRRQSLYDYVPAGAGRREIDRRKRDLDARAHALAESRRDRRRDPDSAAPARRRPPRTGGPTTAPSWPRRPSAGRSSTRSSCRTSAG